MTALFVNQLTTLDFSYLDPARGVVGESWLVDVTLEGDLDEQGMVFDFGHVKKKIKASLDILADHRLLVPANHPHVIISSEQNQLNITMVAGSGDQIQCSSPAQAILLVNETTITPEILTPILEDELLKDVPANVTSIKLNIYPEAIPGAFYHYSHGLKKHLGDCQRIAHGHRSPIHIYLDENRDSDLEDEWAETWKDIYIATREDLLTEFDLNGIVHLKFGYTSDQGYFELTIAKSRCYLLDTDTTVELLAEHIASEHKSRFPASRVKVVAFEGFNKGSICEK